MSWSLYVVHVFDAFNSGALLDCAGKCWALPSYSHHEDSSKVCNCFDLLSEIVHLPLEGRLQSLGDRKYYLKWWESM